jgi:hypothetical protein
VKFFSIASIAASLICRGVEKCGSPAPKSERFTPSDFNFSAAAVIAMVAETSMRPMRSANTFVAVAVVILSSLADLDHEIKRGLWFEV